MTESFSGVRGIWGLDLKEANVRNYALAISKYLDESDADNKKIVIGRDSRIHGKLIEDIFIDILKKHGFEIILVGINPTPLIEETVRSYKASFGIIITASHNPPEYNGFKFLAKEGNILYPEEMSKIIEYSKIDLNLLTASQNGIILDKENEAKEIYIDFLKQILEEKSIYSSVLNAKTKILLDPNGGAASNLLTTLLDTFNISSKEINNEIGVFNRQIEPNQESIAYLQDMLKNDEFALAAGFDCDADRIELVSKKFGVVSGHYVLALVTKYLLDKYKGSYHGKIICNDATSYLVKDIVQDHNFDWIETEVGEVNIIKKHDEKAMYFGGEGSSGGVIIPPSRCRDGILALLVIIGMLNETNKTLDEAIEELPTYYTLQEIIRNNQNWTQARSKLIEICLQKNLAYKANGGNSGSLKIFTDKGFVYIRESKTEHGVIRVIADSKDLETSKRMLTKGLELVNEIS